VRAGSLNREDAKVQKMSERQGGGKTPLSQAEQERYFFTELTNGENLSKAGK